MKQPLNLTSGDIEVFCWLWMLRVMTLEQIRRVRYYQPETGQLSSLDNVRKRLKRLWDADYLSGQKLPQTNQRVYSLGPRALTPLRTYHGISQRQLYQPRRIDGEDLLAPLFVSEFAVRVTESLRDSEIVLKELLPFDLPFYHSHAVGDASKQKHVERFVTQEDIHLPGENASLRLQPDLVFALEAGGFNRIFYLELDRSWESPEEIARRQLGYHQQMADPHAASSRYLWQRYGSMVDFRVLLVSSSQKRLDRLRECLEDQPGYDLTIFGNLEYLQGNVVFDGVWTTSSGAGQPLVDRLKD